MTSRSTAQIDTLRDVPKRSDFAIAFAGWMGARAAVAQSEAAPFNEKTDETIGVAVDALQRAEWKLLQTPAQDFLEIRDRARVALEMCVTADTDGEPADNRHLLMLSALVSEILKYQPRADD